MTAPDQPLPLVVLDQARFGHISPTMPLADPARYAGDLQATGSRSSPDPDPDTAYRLRDRLLTYPADLLHIELGGNHLVQDTPIETGLQNYHDMIVFCRDTHDSDASVLLTPRPIRILMRFYRVVTSAIRPRGRRRALSS
ncbi:hypothetical protein ACFWAY_47670 [Rhodococcus sp. NPDC059968]|uniref:hypothetical protein n=1 Tax=Rhodococcus sp. NPDC059968 TaxID=3347017 RepID=UPI00366C5C85